MRTALSFALLATITLATARAQAQVRVEMSADRNEITADQTLVVRVHVQAQSDGSPEITLPEFEGFQIVQRSVQRPMQVSFGMGQQAVVTSSTNYAFVLSPIAPGRFAIDPVRVTVDGRVYKSQPLTLVVRGAAAAAAPPGGSPQQSQTGGSDPQQQGAQTAQDAQAAPQAGGDVWTFDQDAFLRTVIDKPEPFVGEQVTATIYLYTRRNLQQVPSVQSEATTDGFWTHDLLSAARALEPTRQAVRGRAFWVYTLRRFAAFPLKPGELTIGAMTLTLSRDSIFDIFDRGRAQGDLQRSGVPVALHVKPLPEAGRPAGDIAVGRFELSTTLDRAAVATGDAVTLTATLRGSGNIRALRLPAPVVDGLRILEPESREVIESPNDLVQGTRTLAFIVVPQAPGKYVIPALSVETFDPSTQQYLRVASQPLELTAAGNPQAAAQPAAPAEPAAPEAEEDGAPAERFAPIRTHSALTRTRSSLAAQPFYPWALLLPPALWLLNVLVPLLRRRRRERAAQGGPRETLRAAKHKLSEAEAALSANDARSFHAQLALAVTGALEARLGEPVGGVTQGHLREKLAQASMPPELANALLDVLARCDFARFSSATVSEEDMRGVLRSVQRHWDALAAFSPTQPERA